MIANIHGFVKSIGHALRGLRYVFASQRNMKIHGAVAVAALALAFFFETQPGFELTGGEWMALLFCMFLVLITETLNTSVEVLVDLVTRERQTKAMISKDVAAAAVLLAAVNALVIGGILFFDRLYTLCYLWLLDPSHSLISKGT